MLRTRIVLAILLVLATVALSACSLSLPQGTTGYIALIPFWDEEQGIQGVQPPEGWSEEAKLVQVAFPGKSQEILDQFLVEAHLSALPASTGRLKGKTFTWDLYTFESRLEGVPAESVHFDMAVAETESTYYIVMLLTLPTAYYADPALYDTLFAHALYALEPME